VSEFLHLLPPDEALNVWLAAIPDPVEFDCEQLDTALALDRVLGEDITAPEALPPFPRSTVDGYAVRAADTFGASPGLPAYLDLRGEIRMGQGAELALDAGQTALIHTGGMIPEGADAVVMIEDTQRAHDDQIEVLTAVAPGEHVLQAGEDVKAGQLVLPAGTRLRPQEIGGLMALGITSVSLRKRPRVGILSTGDELIPPGQELGPGQVRDVNSYSLAALVRRLGGEVSRQLLLRDNRRQLQSALQQARTEDEVIIVTAGSSVSERDLTADAIDELGEPGVLVHGIHIKPGKPTILASAAGTPVLGLPGNPVSAFVIAGFFLPPLLRRMLGIAESTPPASVTASLSVNIASMTGREDFVPVRLKREDDAWLAEPVYGRSNLIFTLVRADGLIRIPPAATGLDRGAQVLVHLF
jgi:molybdopterin molybdotransferase